MRQPQIVEIRAHVNDERSYALEFVREGRDQPEPLPAIVCGALSAIALADGFGVPIVFIDEHLAMGVGI